MMGHVGGVEAVGGVYDRTPELYAEVIEREYAKLEGFLNVYSGERVRQGERVRGLEECVRATEQALADLQKILAKIDEK